MKIYLKAVIISLTFLISISRIYAQTGNPSKINIHPKREFRGAWVATIENIDWPNHPGESTQQQQSELLRLLDSLQRAGLNAIFFQVRPAADAFYGKGVEPWSKWLTGKQGKVPYPLYDPLEFAIEESHKRGMELHAWFNPYRATTDNKFASLSYDHITNLKPEWFFQYDGMKLFNPGIPEVREYIVKVILNVLDNYNVDGIHLDDYFYPYQVKGQVIGDKQTFSLYGRGFETIKDWRRNNVDLLIKKLTDSIHRHNPRIKFGISPFGIWANKYQNPAGSDTHGGDSYYELYADSRKWIKEGWIDYIVPQLYRPLNDRLVAFNTMVDWWSDNTYNRHLYIGQAPYRIIENKMAAFKMPTQLPDQISYLRQNPRVEGSVFFSAKSLLANPLGFTDSLKCNYYKHVALPPVMLWLDSIPPNPPRELTGRIDSVGIRLNWQAPLLPKDNEPVFGYIIYRFDENDKVDIDDAEHIIYIQFNDKNTFEDTKLIKGKTYLYVITAIDKVKNESERSPTIVIKYDK